MGVSGDAQTGHRFDWFHCHTPLVQTAIVSWHALGGQAMSGESQAAPALGTTDGQGAPRVSAERQDRTSDPSGCPVGHAAQGGPGGCVAMQLHGTQEQAALSPDKQITALLPCRLHFADPSADYRESPKRRP